MKLFRSFLSYGQSGHIWIRQRDFLSALLVTTVVLAWGCHGTRPVLTESPEAKSLVDANNAFALDLYHQLEKKDGNLVFSPFCIYTSLGMTYAGARGQSEVEMAKALHFSLPRQEIHPAFHELLNWLDKLRRSDAVDLAMANSLWPQKKYHLSNTFVELVRTNYDADVHPLDFSNASAAAQQINDWIKRKTDGNIKEMIVASQINPQYSRLFLCNAIYFNGKWLTQFQPKDTKSGPFYISRNKTVAASMMSQFSKFKLTSVAAFGEQDAIQLLELPYSGRNLSMIILLPTESLETTTLDRELTSSNLNRWLAKLDRVPPRKVNVSLPRFTFGHTFDLIDVLKYLGVTTVFGPKADLSGMDGTTNLYVAGVVHKAIIRVNEAGTKVAAATRVHIASKSMPQSFRADHPFIFLIRDNATGCILFMGRVVNPLEH